MSDLIRAAAHARKLSFTKKNTPPRTSVMQRQGGRRAFSSQSRIHGRTPPGYSRNSRSRQNSSYPSKMAMDNAKFALNSEIFNAYAEDAPLDAQKQMVDLKGEAEKRLRKIRHATLATRHFGTMQSATSRQMYRQNNRGTTQTFVNMLRDYYEKRDKPVTPIMPMGTDSGMRNLPDRIFSRADLQRDEIKRAAATYASVEMAPPCPAKTIAKEDMEAGLLEMYTLPGSSGYAQTDAYAEDQPESEQWSGREAHQSLDSDPYVIPGESAYALAAREP